MPKPIITEPRFDFRGGRNTFNSPDLLNLNELLDCTNARISNIAGGFSKRLGTQRMHTTALPGPIKALTTWDAPSGKQIAAIAFNGTSTFRLYTKPFDLTTNFTDRGDISFGNPSISGIPVQNPSFATFRGASSGAPLVLYFAWLGWYVSWDGTTLTYLTGTNNAPGATFIMPYHTRMFASDGNFRKNIFWSKVGDATFFTTGTKTDGGSAMVDMLSGEDLRALEVIGSSLLLIAPTSVMRFTGISSDDIVIQQDTEGISGDVGSYAMNMVERFENVAAVLNERGVYVVTESGLVPLSEKIKPDWDVLDKNNMTSFWNIIYDKLNKDLLCAVLPPEDGISAPKTIYAYNTRVQAWQGPWKFPFAINSFCTCEPATLGSSGLSGPYTLIGGQDGFVRVMNIGNKDDVLSDGTGGTNISMTVTMPILRNEQRTVKAPFTMHLQAQLPLGSNLSVDTSFDNDSYKLNPVQPTGSNVADYEVDLLEDQGFRGLLRFTDTSDQNVTIHGFTLYAHDMQRL